MPEIHPTATIDPQAKLADDVVVGPYCLIGPHAEIGRGTTLASHVVVTNHTRIGEHNRIGHHAVLGGDPQDLKYRGEPTTLTVGNHNDIREFVTMHIGTENGGGSSSVGDHNLFMVGAHVAHDSHIGNRCILANNVLLAGHIIIEDYATLSGGAAVHHFVTVGRYAFVGGNAGVVHDCPPYMITDGHPARVRGVNTIGLQRHRFSEDAIENLQVAYRELYKRDNGSFHQTLHHLCHNGTTSPHVIELAEFLRRAHEGIHGRAREATRPDNKRTNQPR